MKRLGGGFWISPDIATAETVTIHPQELSFVPARIPSDLGLPVDPGSYGIWCAFGKHAESACAGGVRGGDRCWNDDCCYRGRSDWRVWGTTGVGAGDQLWGAADSPAGDNS